MSSNGFDKVAEVVCCVLAIIAIFAMVYSSCLNMLQSKEAMETVQSGSISVYEGDCIECDEERTAGYHGHRTITYYFKMDNGLWLQTLEPLIDTSIDGFAKIKNDIQKGPWTFCYIPLNVWGVEENWVVSIFSEEQILISGEELETVIADEIERWRSVMLASFIMGIVMVLCPVYLVMSKRRERKAKERRLALKKQKREDQKMRKSMNKKK